MAVPAFAVLYTNIRKPNKSGKGKGLARITEAGKGFATLDGAYTFWKNRVVTNNGIASILSNRVGRIAYSDDIKKAYRAGGDELAKTYIKERFGV